MEYSERYLLMVTTNNNNKYYRMIPSAGGDSFTVEYGRVGASCQRRTYPMHSWENKYNEKVRKGYVDQTHLELMDLGLPLLPECWDYPRRGSPVKCEHASPGPGITAP